MRPSSAGDVNALAANLSFFDEIYRQYRRDPGSIDPTWRSLFESDVALAETSPTPAAVAGDDVSAGLWLARVWALVNSYRGRGHLEADLDPLGLMRRDPHPELDPANYGFTQADMQRKVPAQVFGGAHELSLGELIERMRATYCRHVGVEFLHLSAPARKAWLHDRMEGSLNQTPLDRATRVAIFEKLARAESFERFVHHKYVGTKRFSLEGSETAIPLLDLVLEHAGRLGIGETVIGMAHRGRLTVLSQILAKKPREIFAEFEDIDPEAVLGSGDVKYHLGYSTDHVTRGGHELHLSLTFNPSHLEAVDPVVVGRVRGKQRRLRDTRHERVLGLLIHGDAAFAGQGLVAETLNLSEIHGYRTGGTVHVIINNQIGFTATPAEARSTPYATDVAKMLQCPIFHVNGEDPDAVAHVVRLAMEYRHEFRCDVVIDMFCYRKYGHNEADEPSFTQPLMYRRIEQKEPITAMYARRLVADGAIAEEEVSALHARLHQELELELQLARSASRRPSVEAGLGVWAPYAGGPDATVPEADTSISRERVAEIGRLATHLPDGFHPHPKIARLLANRQAMTRGELPIDWATGEMLAFGSLLLEGFLVRLSGQDSARGTFSQRHAIVTDIETGSEYLSLAHLAPNQGEARIYDSALSEAAVLGFEFGYSLDYPDGLIMWEAQFGDFVNGAQVIIDQFISSSEDKWKRISGLTMLLPHGFEGQGPEHSSARFERFLQLCAEDNIQVVNATTPANYFHVLRRQIHRKWRKPLVVLTPKSLLRHPEATSRVDDFARGGFQRVLFDPAPPPAEQVRRVVFCSGKLYYDLAAERKKRDDRATAIVRLEQLYPWRDDLVAAAAAPFPGVKELIWAQEEPHNMGARFFVDPRLRAIAGGRAFRSVSRAESASPATGSTQAHAIEQRKILDEVFAG